MGLAGVGWRDGEKMQTIVTELKKKDPFTPLTRVWELLCCYLLFGKTRKIITLGSG